MKKIKDTIDQEIFQYEKGSIIISYNSIVFNHNLFTFNMKSYDKILNRVLEVIKSNDSIIIDIKNFSVPNSAIIALITVVAKVTRHDYNKSIKICFDSSLDWQFKMVKNIFQNSGPCTIDDINKKVTRASLFNYYTL